MTGTETTVFERRVYYLQFPRGGGMPHHSEPHGKALGCSGGRRRKGKCGHEPLLRFFSGKARQGRVSTSGLASLKNFSRLYWGLLLPTPGVPLGQEEDNSTPESSI